LLVSEQTGLVAKKAMKTAGSENQNRYATMRSKPSTWSGRLEQILLNHVGWKARKPPAKGEVFFLTFPFIELIGRYEVRQSHAKMDL
jgi:hypothetical protein